MRRKKQLRPDPEKVRAFQQRARETARKKQDEARAQGLPRSTGLSRGKGLQRGPDSSDRPRASRPQKGKPAEGPLTPAAWRAAVWGLDDGRCRGCRKPVAVDADSWVWQAHHCLAKQRLRRQRLYDRVWDPGNGIVLCMRCHERHESAAGRVPFEKLPPRIAEFAASLGEWAEDLLRTAHPPGESRRHDDPT